MKNVLSIFLLMLVLAPQSGPAQELSLIALPGADSQHCCQETWQGNGDNERRLFQACLREQQQAGITLRTLHGRYATQDFYRATALPYCREALSASGSWAIAASQVRRTTHLKTLRSGTGS
jgi:hypothetical protein